MSAYEAEGCKTPSYGSYEPCVNCGIAGQRSTWNSLDSCMGASACCQTSPPFGKYTPDNRCDYQERNSRNRYDWKEAFDYGSVKTHFGPGLNYGKDGAGCMYMGSMTPTDASFPWGYPLGGFYNDIGTIYAPTGQDASYGGYVGDLDKDRKDPYQVNDAHACGYNLGVRKPCGSNSDIGRLAKAGVNNAMAAQYGPLAKNSQYGLVNVPFAAYEQL